MPSTPLSPEKLADAKALAQAIREATDAEIEELARTLASISTVRPRPNSGIRRSSKANA